MWLVLQLGSGLPLCAPFFSVTQSSCSAGQASLIDLLVSKGAAVNATDYHGATPLHLACQKGCQSVTVSWLCWRHPRSCESGGDDIVRSGARSCKSGGDDIVRFTLESRSASKMSPFVGFILCSPHV